MNEFMLKNIYVKGVKVTVCEMDTAAKETLGLIAQHKPAYICVTDAGNIVNAHRNSSELQDAINNSAISLPDGRPISMLARAKGIKGIGRVAGPDFMIRMFELTSGKGISHFFLGDTEDTLDKLISMAGEKFRIKVAGSFSPPFRNGRDDSGQNIIDMLNKVSPDLIWVSLGGGKQEIWMKNNFKKLDKGVMVGVGAGFRFLTGDIKRAPLLMQKAGLEWFFRLIQQPQKMAGRYAGTLPYFLFYSAEELLNNNLKER